MKAEVTLMTLENVTNSGLLIGKPLNSKKKSSQKINTYVNVLLSAHFFEIQNNIFIFSYLLHPTCLHLQVATDMSEYVSLVLVFLIAGI